MNIKNKAYVPYNECIQSIFKSNFTFFKSYMSVTMCEFPAENQHPECVLHLGSRVFPLQQLCN